MTLKPKYPHFPSWTTAWMVAMVSLHALPVSGATFLVGDQSELVDAINVSNTNASSNLIVLTDDIVLTSALPAIDTGDAGLSIVGDGFTLSRDPESETEFRILQIDGGDVGIENLTISGGVGEAITIEDGGKGGGGIVVQRSVLTLTGCTISGNSSEGGGGIWIENGSTVTLIRCTISDNSALEGGAGVVVFGETMDRDMDPSTAAFIECTIMGNNSLGAEEAESLGGGILLGGDVEVLISGSTISDNSAQIGGGVCAFYDANLTLINSTISGNSAMMGGGIFGLFSTVTLQHCTVTRNTAEMGAGGIANFAGDMTLRGNLVAGNEAEVASEISSVSEEILADSSNVFGHSGITRETAFGNFTPGSSDLVGTSDGNTPTALGSILNPTLASNGGPTRTHALVAGSPAIDLVSSGPATDQRGVSRPQGVRYDAGAFEVENRSTPDLVASFVEYWHQGTANTISPNSWNLDPGGLLGDDAAHSIASGVLPRGLSLSAMTLTGRFADLGIHTFTIVSRSGINEVRNHFLIQVIPPTLTPLIMGLWVNGDYQPAVILQDRTHGDAAVTELFNLVVPASNPLEMRVNWDYIKGESSWRIVRGNLPQGLILREQVVDGKPVAIISGTPTQTGEFIFVVSVLDWRGRGYQWIRLVVVE